MKYQSIQYGWMMSIAFIVVLACITLSYFLRLGQNPVSFNGLFIVGGIMLIALLTFYKLVVIVSDRTIQLQFGIGLLRFTIRPDKITDLQEVKIPFYVGTGIRITASGMLYNVQGARALKLTYSKGKTIKTIKIGTPDPTALMAAIRTEFP